MAYFFVYKKLEIAKCTWYHKSSKIKLFKSWMEISENRIQRDLYSAFLMKI